MNYISHLNEVFRKFYHDTKLTSMDISMYMALFQFWNLYRFPKEFHINRQEIMQLAKIGSKTTYHKCLKNLNSRKYLKYSPSNNIYEGSRIRMAIFGSASGTTSGLDEGQPLGQPVGHNINSNKHIENKNKLGAPENFLEILNFFKNKTWPEVEAKKFYNYYHAMNWKRNGRDQILNWQALAENWKIKADEIKKNDQKSDLKKWDSENYLNIKKSNDYGKPL